MWCILVTPLLVEPCIIDGCAAYFKNISEVCRHVCTDHVSMLPPSELTTPYHEKVPKLGWRCRLCRQDSNGFMEEKRFHFLLKHADVIKKHSEEG